MALEPLAGLRVADLFAGSGALGIEALSRGAAFVDFVEVHGDARRVLERNVTALGLEATCRTWSLALPRGLPRLRAVLAAADLVLLDPPYDEPAGRATLAALGAGGWLAGGARVVYEHRARDASPEREGALARRRERNYGDTAVATYEVTAAATGPSTEEPR